MKAILIDKLIENLNLESRFFRRALRMAIAVFIAVFLYRYFSLTQGFWLPLTVVVVMQSTTAATLRKGLQRFLGTIIGIILGSLIVLKIHNPNIIDFLLVLFLCVAYYLKSFNLVNYGIFVVPLTIMVVFLVSAIVPQESHHLILARLYDTTLGAILGVLITLFVFPSSLKQDIDKAIKKTLVVQYQYLNTILNLMLQETNGKQCCRQKRLEFENCLSTNRLLFNDWMYELWLKVEPKHRHENMVIQLEKLGQFLFSLHQLARQSYSETLPKDLRNSLEILSHAAQQTAKNAAKNSFTDLPIFTSQLADLHENKKHSISNDLLSVTALLADLEGYFKCLAEFQILQSKQL